MDLEVRRLVGITDTKETKTASTFTANFNKTYDILNFKNEDVDINFIAMSLSKICRYIGHTGEDPQDFLSVAQHSVMMAEAILLVTGDPMKAMEALVHDSPEAYTGDVAAPLKAVIKHIIKPIEDAIEKIIFENLGLCYPPDPLIKHVDINICKYELTFAVHNPDTNKYGYDFWSPEDSYFKFMAMFDRLKLLIEMEVTVSRNELLKNKELKPAGEYVIDDSNARLKNFLINVDDALSRVLLFKFMDFTLETSNRFKEEDCQYLMVDVTNETVKHFKTKQPRDLKNNVLETINEVSMLYFMRVKEFGKNLKAISVEGNITTFEINGLNYDVEISSKDRLELLNLA